MIRGLPVLTVTGPTNIEIDTIEYDSRLVRGDSLFFAVNGFAHDGYDFIKQAKAGGAVAVMGVRNGCNAVPTHVQVADIRQAMADVAARFYGFPGRYLDVCGVSGTNGKTTVCHLIRRILEKSGKKAGMVTSIVYDTAGETFPAERTTPESLDLQRLLLLMRKNRCTHAVIEVSSHSLVLKRVEHIQFQVAVFTNFTRDHLDFHHTMDEYLRAKSLLLEKLDSEYGCAVINLDVPEFRQFFGGLKSSHLTYSLSDTSADVYARSYQFESDRTMFDLVTPAGSRTVTYHLPGRFNLINALAAAAAGLASGVDLDSIVGGLETAGPVPGRLNVVKSTAPFTVYVDYAHTPDAIERLCQSAREIAQRNLLLLSGCGGNRDKGKRPLMGRAATTFADFAVITSDNPRDEDPQAIMEEIVSGIRSDNYECHVDRRKAIRAILQRAQPGDTIVLAGKGAEKYQEIKGVKHPFDEVKEVQIALAEAGYGQSEQDASS
ncbi:MAG TPA: UDP-N-acetylmuramoyl-L-alanyl-D-glutamate--2,6-diaminopimelate ligase [Candidatus Deferrimicrobium sp.]|nr:UDP-N-acetylmuramoyl-L-alanyl-D-glutamate--2,6-diaminopimelate ligase [Candidatus Deferrimicrobium sp.]